MLNFNVTFMKIYFSFIFGIIFNSSLCGAQSLENKFNEDKKQQEELNQKLKTFKSQSTLNVYCYNTDVTVKVQFYFWKFIKHSSGITYVISGKIYRSQSPNFTMKTFNLLDPNDFYQDVFGNWENKTLECLAGTSKNFCELVDTTPKPSIENNLIKWSSNCSLRQ